MSQNGGSGVKTQPVSHQLEEINIQLLPPHPFFFFFAVLSRKDSTLLTFLIWSDVISLPSLDMAPSATMITLRREPRLLCCEGNQSIPLCRLNSRRGRFKSKVTFRHSYVCQPPAQVVLPALIWGHLWDEDPVSTAGLGRHQGQVTAAI